MVTIDKVNRGVANYADAEIISKIADGELKKVLLGAGLSLYINNLEKVIMSYKDNPLVSALGVFHPDGNIDIERIGEAIKANMSPSGTRIDIKLLGVNMTLHQSDIDNMIYYINNA